MENIQKIIIQLKKDKVKFVVIGGIASILYGVDRATFDLDIILYPSITNLSKFIVSISKLGYKNIKIWDKHIGWLDYSNIINIILDDFFTHKTLKFAGDNIIDLDAILVSEDYYNTLIKTTVSLKDGKFYIPSIQELIKMKSKTKRLQDKYDITELEKIIKLRKK